MLEPFDKSKHYNLLIAENKKNDKKKRVSFSLFQADTFEEIANLRKMRENQLNNFVLSKNKTNEMRGQSKEKKMHLSQDSNVSNSSNNSNQLSSGAFKGSSSNSLSSQPKDVNTHHIHQDFKIEYIDYNKFDEVIKIPKPPKPPKPQKSIETHSDNLEIPKIIEKPQQQNNNQQNIQPNLIQNNTQLIPKNPEVNQENERIEKERIEKEKKEKEEKERIEKEDKERKEKEEKEKEEKEKEEKERIEREEKERLEKEEKERKEREEKERIEREEKEKKEREEKERLEKEEKERKEREEKERIEKEEKERLEREEKERKEREEKERLEKEEKERQERQDNFNKCTSNLFNIVALVFGSGSKYLPYYYQIFMEKIREKREKEINDYLDYEETDKEFYSKITALSHDYFLRSYYNNFMQEIRRRIIKRKSYELHKKLAEERVKYKIYTTKAAVLSSLFNFAQKQRAWIHSIRAELSKSLKWTCLDSLKLYVNYRKIKRYLKQKKIQKIFNALRSNKEMSTELIKKSHKVILIFLYKSFFQKVKKDILLKKGRRVNNKLANEFRNYSLMKKVFSMLGEYYRMKKEKMMKSKRMFNMKHENKDFINIKVTQKDTMRFKNNATVRHVSNKINVV